MQKPDGLTIVNEEIFAKISNEMPVDRLHGLGRKTAKCLNNLGINTIKELGDAPISFLTTHFGFWGHILKSMGQGINNSPVQYYWEHGEPKSMGHSHTLPIDVSNMEVIKAFILMLCQKVATRLRNEKKATYTVALTIRYRDFSTFCYRKTAGYLVDTPHGLYGVCLKILSEIGALKKSVRLLGVTATNLINQPDQPYLIEEFEKIERLNRTIVEINNKYGEFTIKPTSLLILNQHP
jgi:DNA polymerase IV